MFMQYYDVRENIASLLYLYDYNNVVSNTFFNIPNRGVIIIRNRQVQKIFHRIYGCSTK